MPFITIDTNALLNLISGDPLTVFARFFVLFGWIPILWIIYEGAKLMWINWRQDKYASTFKFVLLAIDVPKENEQLPKAVENIFLHLTGAYGGVDWIEKWWIGKFQPTFSFEICSHGGYIQFYIRCQTKFRDLIESAIFSQYPEAEINEVEDYTKKFDHIRFPHLDYDVFGSEFTLKNKSFFPIRTYPEFEEKLAGEFKDPLGTLLETLSKVRPEEEVWLQLLVTPTDSSWKKKGEQYIKKVVGLGEKPKPSAISKVIGFPLQLAGELVQHATGAGGAAPEKKKDDNKGMLLLQIPDVKATLDAVAYKIAKPGFACKIRYVYLAPRSVKSNPRVLSGLKGAFGQFNALHLNSFGGYLPATTKEDYFWEKWSVDKKKNRIMRYYKNRSGFGAPPFILNTEELATLFHFPITTVKAPLVSKTESRRAEPPTGLPVSTNLPGGGPSTPPSGESPKRTPPPGVPFV